MKRSVFYLWMMMVAIVTSCSNDKTSPTVEKEKVTIYLDYNNLAKIYVHAFSSIVSFDNEIVNAELVDGEVYIRGIKEGNTIVKTESKLGKEKEIYVVVKCALYHKRWTFISYGVNIDCVDPGIKLTIEEETKQYLLSTMKSDGEGADIVFFKDDKLELKTILNNGYERIEGVFLYNPNGVTLQFGQENEMQCEFSIIKQNGIRWLATFTHDLSNIYKEKYPNMVNSVTINYSLEAVDII